MDIPYYENFHSKGHLLHRLRESEPVPTRDALRIWNPKETEHSVPTFALNTAGHSFHILLFFLLTIFLVFFTA
jgi:hypothetical protein